MFALTRACFAVRVRYMNVDARLFPGEEEQPERSFTDSNHW
jgi:hypothetical protein